MRDAAIEKLYMGGKIDREVDAALGLNKGATAYWRYRNDCPPNGIPGRTPGEYVIYNRGTGEILAMGTGQQCAEALGMVWGGFRQMVCNAKIGLSKKYIVVKLTADEEIA